MVSTYVDNYMIQTRCCLQSEGIKLWLPPYYIEGIGSIDSELQVFITFSVHIFKFFELISYVY